MSGLDWQWPLEDGESLLWQGRPAPRCYTFRRWKIAAAGTFLFLASSFWLMLAYELMQAENHPWWLVLFPAPLVIISLLFGPVHLIVARIEWEQIFYALTDSRLLVRGGLFSPRFKTYPLDKLVDWQQKDYSNQLVSLRLRMNDQPSVILHCLEQPQNLLRHLDREVNPDDTQGDSV